MKFSFTSILLVFITLQVFSQLPGFEWANQCGNPPNTSDTKTTLATCPDGNFCLTGEFLDTVQFGSKMLVSAGGTDIFLVKQTAEGAPVWSIRVGGADYDYVQKIITDDEGNVIVTGYFYGTTQIGQDQYASFGSQDIFVAKFNAGGDFLWSYRAGGIMADYIAGLSLDQDQNIVFTGYFYNEITFGDTTIAATSSSDIYLGKLSSDGQLIWVTSAGGSSSDQVRSAYCDEEGFILLSGSFYYDITLGDTTLSTINPVGVFIAKYHPDGLLEQAFQLDGTYLTTEVNVAAGQDGDFYIAGNFSEALTFGNKTFEAGEFNQDIYLAKYDASCDLQWARHAYSYASDQVVGLEIDAFNNVYLAGHYLDTIHFDLLSLPYTLCCGSREIFIVSYNAAGDVLWGEQVTGTRANLQSLAMNGQDELLISGLFSEEVNFGHIKLSNFDSFQNYVSCLKTEVFTAVEPDLELNRMIVSPNPASENIRILSGVNKSQAGYFIYSINGLLITSGRLNFDGIIDIGNLPAGLYLLQISSEKESTPHSCLFIKK